MSDNEQPRRDLAPWGLAAASLVLNLTGITWGLPARWHPDEKTDVVARMVKDGTLAPDSFINPSLPLYVQMPILWVQGRAATAGLLSDALADPLLAARALAALAGAAAVGLMAAAGTGDRATSRLAALLLALAPGVVNLCHFATPEAWLLLGTAATLVLARRHLEGGVPAAALGLALGLTASTKYTAAALILPCLVATFARPARPWRPSAGLSWIVSGMALLGVGVAVIVAGDAALAARLHLPDLRLLHPDQAIAFVRGLERSALSVGMFLVATGGLALAREGWARRLARADVVVMLAAAAAGFVLGTPFAILDSRGFLSGLAFNQQTRHEYKGLVGASTSFGPYLGFFVDALTGPVAVAALLGALVALGRASRGDRALLVPLAGAVAPYLLVASSGHRAMRFLVPALPGTVLLAAAALRALPSPRVRVPLTAAVLARAALAAILVVRLFFVDARLVAARWLSAQVPPGDPVDVITNNPGYGPALPPGRMRVVPTLSREMAPPERFREAALRYPHEAAPWLVLPAAYYERFLDHPDQAPEREQFFRDLLEGRSGFDVVARFRQEGWRRPPAEFVDPEIVVLRKRPADEGR